jgi:D-alanyl-D-alanine carboxypeptidase
MRSVRRASANVAICGLTALAFVASALLSPSFAAHSRRPQPYAASPEKDAAIVEDGATGKVLYERDPDAIRYPASLTKMMTLYLLFEALEKGKLTLETPLVASAHASEQAPTKVGIKPGDTIPVDTAIKAITVLSANDIAVVIAETLGGSESRFAEMMTKEAHALGMTRTHFDNASGLPDLQQLTTARDMALLGRHLAYDFPQYFDYFSTPAFTFHGRAYRNHDNLLGAFDGTDGIKTGYTQLSGFNLVSSVVRGKKHVIGVLMGGPTAVARDREMMRMLSSTFDAAQKNPTLLADANVPWEGGAGPAFDPFHRNPGDIVTVAALAPPAPAPIPPTQSAGATPDTAPSGVVTNGKTQLADLQAKTLSPSAAATTAALASAAVPDTDTSVDSGEIDQGDIAGLSFLVPSSDATIKRWTVQIGAFTSEALAQTQLSAYARKAVDLLGDAKRLVVEFENAEGHTLYRARFGVFAEDEARDLCRRMTRRGETCFAVPQKPAE